MMLAFPTRQVDMQKASVLVRSYFEKLYNNLGVMGFQIEKVYANTKKDTWIVECSLYTSMGSEQRTYYKIKVNIKTGAFELIERKG